MIAIRTFSHPKHSFHPAMAQSSQLISHPLSAWIDEVARAYTSATSAASATCAPKTTEAATPAKLDTLAPRVSVEEHADRYEVLAELPGFAREQIKVAVDGKHVSIHTTIEPIAEKPDAATTSAKLIYTNRVHANYARSFTLPSAVVAEAVSASLENGVLSLRLPKLAVPPVHHITVQ